MDFSFVTFERIINDLKNKNKLLGFLDNIHFYYSHYTFSRRPFYIFVFLYYGDTLYCDDKTITYNLEVSLKISRFISKLLSNLSEYNINFSFRILKDSLEKSDSLFLVMYVISYFSLEKDRDMFIFEDFHYDIDSDNADILEEIAIKKIINISKSGNWDHVKNLSYVIDTFNLLFAYESENYFSFIVLKNSSDDNLIKLIKTILSIEKIDDNLEFDWKMLNKSLKINSICENFETHKKDNSEFYRENKIFIDKFLRA